MRNKKKGELFFLASFSGILLFGFCDVCLGGLVGNYISNTGDHGLPINTYGVWGVVANVTDFLLGLIGILGVLAFVISGIQYLTAGGDEKVAEKAKHTMTFAVLGLAIVLSAYVVILTVEYLLSDTWNGAI